MHNRLKQFLSAENITQAQFASTINIGRANISHVLSGRNKPGYDFIKAIMLGYPHLNINWLMLGTGKMYDLSLPPKEKPVADGTIIFDEGDEELELFGRDDANDVEIPEEEESIVEDEATEQILNSPADIALLTSLKESVNTIQTPVKQRRVSKIVVLFDDGSFQEL